MVDPKRVEQARALLEQQGYQPPAVDPARVEAARKHLQQTAQSQPEKKGFWGKTADFGKNVAKGAAQPFARLGTTAVNISAASGDVFGAVKAKIKGDKEAEQKAVARGFQNLYKSRNVPFLGETAPITTPKEALTTGVDAGLTLAPLGPAKAAAQVGKASVKQVLVKGGKQIAIGTSQGYLSDVSRNIQEGKKGAAVFKPGTGTVFGTALPAVGTTVGATKAGLSQTKSALTQSAKAKLAKTYEEVFTGTKAAKKSLQKSTQAGKSPAKFLAEHGYVLDVKNGKIDAIATIQKLDQDAQPLEDVLDDILRQTDQRLATPDYVNLNKLGELAKKRLTTAESKASGTLSDQYNEVERIITEFKKQFGESVNLSTLNQIKRGQWRQSRSFDISRPKFSYDVNSALGKEAKELIEQKVPEADIKAFNAYLGDYHDAIKNLQKVDGNAVKGGRLGRYFARTIGAVAGAKGGPIGSVVGAQIGDKVAEIAQNNYIAGPVKRLILSRIPKDSPMYAEAQKALAKLKVKQSLMALPAPRPGAPKASNNVPIPLPAKTQSTLDKAGKTSLY